MTAPVLVLFGPTASGKTAVLDRLFGRTESPYRAEVVSADSMQVYRGMDIGTAKPDTELLSRLPHHLIDIRDPDESFNVGDFVRLADEACIDIASRGFLPVVSGGTGFYLKHFVEGLPETPPADPEVREALRRDLETRGSEVLAEELLRVDPESASRIHPNDKYRLTRALEVFRSTGRPLSSYRASSSGPGRPDYRFLCLALERDREDTYRRIDERTRLMFAAGLPDEVVRLRERGYGADAPGMRAIGYREFFDGDGGFSSSCLDDIEATVARNSRRYAKRQIVFASSIPGLRRIRADVPVEDLAENVLKEIIRFFAGT